MLDSIDAHPNGIFRGDVVTPLVVRQVPRCRHPAFVCLIDQNLSLGETRLFDLDADHTAVGPFVHFGPDLRVRDVIRPRDAVVVRGFDLVLASKSAEVRAGWKESRPNGISAIDAVSRGEDPIGKELAGRPGRSHPVREENDPVVGDLFSTPLVDEIEVVVGVKINHARQDGDVAFEIDHLKP